MRTPNVVPSGQQGRQMQPHMLSRKRGSDPFRMLQSDIDRALDGFMRVFNMPMHHLLSPSSSLWEAGFGEGGMPRIDICDKNNEVEITAELPGVKESDIDISCGDGMLTITANAEAEEDIEERDYVLHERTAGRMRRILPLPEDLDPDQAKASFKNGLLTIRIPRKPEASRSKKRIEVQSGEASAGQASAAKGGASAQSTKASSKTAEASQSKPSAHR